MNHSFWPRLGTMVIVGLAIALALGSCQARPAPAPPLAPYQPSRPPALPPSSPVQPIPALPSTPGLAETDKAVIIEFARAFTPLHEDWQKYRRAYEEWRQQVACAEPAMTASLNGFVSSFQGIKRTISQVPQASPVREAAQSLAEAADKEEAALIEMRANWKPGTEDVFKKYEADRLAADKLRRQAAQALSELSIASRAENLQAIDQYRQARRAIERDWDALHLDYDSWSQSQEKSAAETLEKLAARSQGLLNRVYVLPAPRPLEKPADLLVAAAEKEEAAWRKLKAAWKPGDEASLAAYEKERLSVNKLRRESSVGVEAVAAIGLRQNQELLGQFSSLHDQVDRAWNDFRSQYNAWRNKGGDCDRESLRRQLSERLAGFQALARRTYALPQSAVVRPLAELVNQAAEREEIALRQLRDNWKPYDSSFYQAYEEEWVTIDRLRRQAAASLTDLLRKSGVSPAEVAPPK